MTTPPPDHPQEPHDGCDCAELCSMGPTCPGGMLARLPGSGCWRSAEPDLGEDPDGDQDEQVAILLAHRQRAPHPFDPNPEDEFCAWCAGPEELATHE